MAGEVVAVADGMEEAVVAAIRVLGKGGVAVFPTETVYGIGVRTGDAAALEKLRTLKKRPEARPFQLLVADIDMAGSVGAVFSARAMRLANSFWPGPMTLVVPDGTGSGTLGIRIPDSEFVLAVCRRLGRPLITSSANPAGAPPPTDAAMADAFGDGADILVDGGPVVGGTASTVVRCGDNDYEVLRVGGISEDAIDAAWNGK